MFSIASVVKTSRFGCRSGFEHELIDEALDVELPQDELQPSSMRFSARGTRSKERTGTGVKLVSGLTREEGHHQNC